MCKHSTPPSISKIIFSGIKVGQVCQLLRMCDYLTLQIVISNGISMGRCIIIHSNKSKINVCSIHSHSRVSDSRHRNPSKDGEIDAISQRNNAHHDAYTSECIMFGNVLRLIACTFFSVDPYMLVICLQVQF